MSALHALPPAETRILVVDDDGDLADALCEVLCDAGYQVASAGNGFEALRALGDQPLPDLILLDLMMPIMDGYSFRQLQLADPRLAVVPTIAMSAGPIDGRIHEMRLTAWMPKPVSVAALIGAVERHRLRRGAEPAAVATASGHSMQFYRTSEQLAAGVAGFLAPALTAGDGAIVLATAEHWQRFEAALADAGCDPARARARGELQVVDARSLLGALSVDGRVVDRRFDQVLMPLMAGAAQAHRRLRVYGELVDLLWQGGDVAGALALEQRWNRLLATTRCDLHCAYAAPASALQQTSVAWLRQQHTGAAVAA
jgi:CheY-like chemotaxis protein